MSSVSRPDGRIAAMTASSIVLIKGPLAQGVEAGRAADGTNLGC